MKKPEIIRKRGRIGHLKKGAPIEHTDEFGIEWIKEENIEWDER